MNLEASRVLALTPSQAGMIEHAAVQASRAAAQESVLISQLSSGTLDTSLLTDTSLHLPKLKLPNFDGNILK